MSVHTTYEAASDAVPYWSVVERNLGWMGNTEAEQQERQQKLHDVVIGVAGCGGIGGAIADRLVRMGVRNLKLADPDKFDASNINRQHGAEASTIGGNKAEVTAEKVYALTRDVNIEVYPEGISDDSADEFVAGCDYVLDKIELYEVGARYALHRAFRRSERPRFMLLTPVFGHKAFVFKWTRDSMTAEEYFGVPEEKPLSDEDVRQLVRRFIPDLPAFPSPEVLDDWFVNDRTVPIFAGTPPLAQGLLATRIGMAITGLDQLPHARPLPVTPGYSTFDAMTWEAKMVDGKWW